ncbi:hypothetical protein Salat_2605700 [Sesamum alatum]|uniref:Uncharacterized protein n=1 Tax=Sesamum alatum TaxID=300844 RepID=A0AAE1XN88_9LAMI|nr:hypothetical protein Salat_2605700 [Sesamum alatum]
MGKFYSMVRGYMNLVQFANGLLRDQPHLPSVLRFSVGIMARLSAKVIRVCGARRVFFDFTKSMNVGASHSASSARTRYSAMHDSGGGFIDGFLGGQQLHTSHSQPNISSSQPIAQATLPTHIPSPHFRSSPVYVTSSPFQLLLNRMVLDSEVAVVDVMHRYVVVVVLGFESGKGFGLGARL